jgi:hypothetical protein
MSLKRTKLLGIQAVTGINTVGILTVGVTQTAGGVGIASTTYLRGVIMHNTGLGTVHHHFMFIQWCFNNWCWYYRTSSCKS